MGAIATGVLFVFTLLWGIANVLLMITIVLALINWLPWRAPIGWLVIVLALTGLRFAAAAVVAKTTKDSAAA